MKPIPSRNGTGADYLISRLPQMLVAAITVWKKTANLLQRYACTKLKQTEEKLNCWWVYIVTKRPNLPNQLLLQQLNPRLLIQANWLVLTITISQFETWATDYAPELRLTTCAKAQLAERLIACVSEMILYLSTRSRSICYHPGSTLDQNKLQM